METDNIEEIPNIVKEYGVGILTNFFSKKYADKLFTDSKQWLIDLDIGLTEDISTWNTTNMPYGPRYGMMQDIISHCPAFWKLRSDMKPLFSSLYDTDELYTSIDGASIYPYKKRYCNNKHWPHIDQTEKSGFMCYQSQFVATDTSACFMATIGSNRKHKNIMKELNIETSKANWYKFNDNDIETLKIKFGDDYQVPIIANKGSVIFWDSRTIHSAKYQDLDDDRWRAVFYVCMRPKNSYTKRNITTLKKAMLGGRTTNHWGTKMFAISAMHDTRTEVVKLYDREKLCYVEEFDEVLCDITPDL